MPSDQKAVHQEAIQLLVSGEGSFRNLRHALVPEPPMNCESQQVFDWGATISVMRLGHLSTSGQMRMVEVYAKRWGIATTEVDEFEPPGDKVG